MFARVPRLFELWVITEGHQTTKKHMSKIAHCLDGCSPTKNSSSLCSHYGTMITIDILPNSRLQYRYGG